MSSATLRSRLRAMNAPNTGAEGEPFNLRAWFAGFLGWLILLTGVGIWAFQRVEQGSGGDLGVWLAAVLLFYLSLCCLFFPLPTTWVVLLLASNDVAFVASAPVRVATVAVLCAGATAVANLNEYHILTFLLRYRTVGRLRELRLYRRAAAWFEVAPFWTIAAVSFIPIPVDVIRMLAIAARYPRLPFAGAYFLGRFVRYGLLAVSSVWLALGPLEIAIVQAILAALAASKVIHAALRRRSRTGSTDATRNEPTDLSRLVTPSETS